MRGSPRPWPRVAPRHSNEIGANAVADGLEEEDEATEVEVRRAARPEGSGAYGRQSIVV